MSLKSEGISNKCKFIAGHVGLKDRRVQQCISATQKGLENSGERASFEWRGESDQTRHSRADRTVKNAQRSS